MKEPRKLSSSLTHTKPRCTLSIQMDSTHAADIMGWEQGRSALGGQRDVCVGEATAGISAEVLLGLLDSQQSGNSLQTKSKLGPLLILTFHWTSIIAGNRPLALSLVSHFHLTPMGELNVRLDSTDHGVCQSCPYQSVSDGARPAAYLWLAPSWMCCVLIGSAVWEGWSL